MPATMKGGSTPRATHSSTARPASTTHSDTLVPKITRKCSLAVAALLRIGSPSRLAGAFDANRNLVGFAFGFLGKLNGRLILWSQLTGVHPAHQSTGVGRLLKFEQRQRARDMGLNAVVWAFDPLQASNAAFNLGVLGATCRTYEVDMYGARTDALNVGRATD